MRRTVLLAVVLLTGCGPAAPTEPVTPARAAEPQHVRLGWRESYPQTGERLRFAVDSLTVSAEGWSAEIGITNSTRRSFQLGVEPAQLSFGLMLFATGELEELERLNREGRVPTVRLAATIDPPPPDLLVPGATWHATLSSPGSLADGSWVRVTFGPLRSVGDPPEGLEPIVRWITDRTHQL